jgi:molybdenum cofactor cytidylyltransferase
MPHKIDVQTGATAIILLAASASTRLGRPKQFVLWNGEPLLRHSAVVALCARLGPVIVVLGAVERECRELLAGLSLEIVVNNSWAEGMGGSIAAGMIAVQNSVNPLQNVIIMLCDQPYVSSATLHSLCDEQRRTRSAVVASRYCESDNTLGVPALFTSARFATLAQLCGTLGAKKLIASESSPAFIDCPEAVPDIDTPADMLETPSPPLGKISGRGARHFISLLWRRQKFDIRQTQKKSAICEEN